VTSTSLPIKDASSEITSASHIKTRSSSISFSSVTRLGKKKGGRSI
jgi:hypothetical protein